MDISWLSTQAKQIHGVFVGVFYAFAAVLLVIGVVIEFFGIPVGKVPAFSQLIGRALVAAILLVAYPEISNMVAAIADSLAEKVGDIGSVHNTLDSAASILKQHSWSWTSIGDTLLSVVAYATYGILYVTVFLFDAAVVYAIILLYIFSPVLIVFYILPQTSSMTTGLFRTLFEVSSWKIVWSVLGTLLWSTALHDFEIQGQNFITLLALTLMLALSVILVPIIVRVLISGTATSVSGQVGGLAAAALTGGLASPGAVAGLAAKGSGKTYRQAWNFAKRTPQASGKVFAGARSTHRELRSEFGRKIKAKPTDQNN